MRDYSCVAIALCELYGAESLGKRTNLVNLYKDRVGATHVDTLLEVLNIGNEVIAYKLATVATDKIFQPSQSFSAIPSSIESMG